MLTQREYLEVAPVLLRITTESSECVREVTAYESLICIIQTLIQNIAQYLWTLNLVKSELVNKMLNLK